MKGWEEGWNCMFKALETLQPEDLLKTVTIRGQGLTVMDAILRQISHYGYHTGQLVYLAKMIKGADWQPLSIPRGCRKNINRRKEIKILFMIFKGFQFPGTGVK
jgi:hypothetical protein